MEKEKHKISIIIPSYNHSKYIKQTIHSIWNQVYKNIEIIVVDDHSSDSSVSKLKVLQQNSPSPFILHVNQENYGISQTLNKALELCTGDLVCFIASDDYFSEDRFTSAIQLFQSSKTLKLVYSNGRELIGNNIGEEIHRKKVKQLLASPPKTILNFLYTNVSPIFLQTALIDAHFLKETGGFNGNILADDWYLNTRMFEQISEKNEYTFDDTIVIYYRRHPNNIHKNTQRHSALKMQFIDKVTPKNLKKDAYFNILSSMAFEELKKRNWSASAAYHWKAQRHKANLLLLIKYLLKALLKSLQFSPSKG